MLRKQFELPEEDVQFLDNNGYEWETIIESNHKWLLIHKFPVPEGYNTSEVTAALRIDNGYPVSQIDMVYFFPHLTLNSGKQIKALANQNLEGKVFQRWSRHRTGVNPWRPGVDGVSTHSELIKYWLDREK